jgi:3-hydroxyisobutyrate dehydrogenase/2-hydroxy-3-oxopropionate reductase
MGQPMASNLLKKGFALKTWNRRPVEAFAPTAAPTPAECVRGADVVVTMLSDRLALARVLGGTDGALAGLGQGSLFIDMATVGRAAVLEAARAVKARGGRFVDAPVSGTVGPAERGELLALVGGSSEDVERARPVLGAMCSRILYAGPVGQGQALKVVLNGIGAHQLLAFTSMLALGERAGLSREVLIEAFTTGAFATPSYVQKRAKVLARDYSAEFSLELARKDCAVNVELQDEVGLVLPVHRACMAACEEGVRAGWGAEDLYALEKYFARR